MLLLPPDEQPRAIVVCHCGVPSQRAIAPTCTTGLCWAGGKRGAVVGLNGPHLSASLLPFTAPTNPSGGAGSVGRAGARWARSPDASWHRGAGTCGSAGARVARAGPVPRALNKALLNGHTALRACGDRGAITGQQPPACPGGPTWSTGGELRAWGSGDPAGG